MMGHRHEFVSKSLARGGKTGRGLPFLLLLSGVSQRYNVGVGSVGKETVSLSQRDCRARAAHPSDVTIYVSKIFGTCQIVKRPGKSLT